MAYFFDGAVIMILIVTALTGYCKGFVRYVITMLGTVAAVLVAFLIANMSAENVYNKRALKTPLNRRTFQSL